jgi:hypothetical protein
MSKKMVKKSVNDITKNMGVEYLRQVRTKFDQIDTFDLSRCSGPLAESILYQPYTVFTIANHGNHKGGAFAAGFIFNKIGESVILRTKKAKLFREDVENALALCQSSKSRVYMDPLKNILNLFGENEKKIKVLGNSALNKQLEELAKSLSSRISQANERAAQEIQKLFKTQID